LETRRHLSARSGELNPSFDAREIGRRRQNAVQAAVWIVQAKPVRGRGTADGFVPVAERGVAVVPASA